MSIRRLALLGLIAACALAGAGAGWLAGPGLARYNYFVQTAERVWQEQSQGLTEQTLQSTAFRATGLPASTLYEQARQIRASFQRGGALFGLWCGLVVGCSIVGALHERRRTIWEPDPARCLACARCYLTCPVERERLGLIEDANAEGAVANAECGMRSAE
ncbi:MAG: hypothetical protein NTW86_04665 [Candidatus Sumerlaeota bacterium]|nr:hypothetical protein [Candidatus Sumerlaeota bacterium]